MAEETVPETPPPVKKHWTDGMVRCWWCDHWIEKDAVHCKVEDKLNL